MKNVMFYFAFTFYALSANATSFEEKETDKLLLIQCKHIAWQDVQLLVQPYLSDTLNTALVMQGQSSNYKVSIAAEQLIDEPLPDIIKTILRAIIQADC
ncbi:hypothetical protein ACOI22_00310 [Glaciecola sp. 2405UD65-10]|uniref:hypothetical protein n=1 Tax=Glaciecola sp. 2405UD65-10 TaxID=3397244 RepID=UPI003B5B5594